MRAVNRLVWSDWLYWHRHSQIVYCIGLWNNAEILWSSQACHESDQTVWRSSQGYDEGKLSTSQNYTATRPGAGPYIDFSCVFYFKRGLTDMCNFFALSDYSLLLTPFSGATDPDQLFSDGCRDAEWLEASGFFFLHDALGKRRMARGYGSPLRTHSARTLGNWHLSSITFAK